MGKPLKEKVANLQNETTKNIADLQAVPVNIEVETFQGEREDGTKFQYDYIELEGVRYRFPFQAQQQLKGLLEEKPELKYFKVRKQGEGLKTSYQVFETAPEEKVEDTRKKGK